MQFIDLTEDELENDSFTLSYDVKNKKSWISFHDYIPDFMFSLRNLNIISFKNNGIWLHNVGAFGKFYDGIKSSYFTPVFRIKQENRIVNFILNYIKYDINFYGEKRLLQRPLDYISFHNSYQSTSEIRLIRKETCNKEEYRLANTTRVGAYWTFNKIKDETNNHLKVTLHEKFDEYVENTKQVTCSKKQRMFVDDHVIVKLTHTNSDNTEMRFSDIEFDITPIRL